MQRRSVPVVVVLDPDVRELARVESTLRPRGWTVFTAPDAVEAMSYIDAVRDLLTLVIIDPLDGAVDADSLIEHARRYSPAAGAIYLSARPPHRTVVNSHFVQKPFDENRLLGSARAAVPTGVHFAVFDALDRDG